MSDRFDAEGVRMLLLLAARALGSQKALAAKCGVSPAFVSDMINGGREPSGKPLEYLGLRREVIYVRRTDKGRKP